MKVELSVPSPDENQLGYLSAGTSTMRASSRVRYAPSPTQFCRVPDPIGVLGEGWVTRWFGRESAAWGILCRFFLGIRIAA